jgi:acetyl-CoA carboxylase biotin carboxyl carrier protein
LDCQSGTSPLTLSNPPTPGTNRKFIAVDLEEIKKVIELMKEHDLSYVNLQSEDTKIKLKRGTDLEALQQALAAAPAPAAPAPVAAPAAAAPAPATDAPAALEEGISEITSPMVGTFYRAASPESENFANVGDRIEEDTVVCIIEAMKVMNEIQAEMRGTVVEVLANNTDAVQFGEPLIRVKAD